MNISNQRKKGFIIFQISLSEPMFDESTRLCDVKYKIVFLGPISVGKSALIERFIQNTFDPVKTHTVGIDFLVKNIHYKGSLYRLQLWDTAGQEKFKSLVPNYIKDAHCAVFVYDISRKQTFQGVNMWLELFKEHHAGEAVSILVGNKNDLKEKKEVSRKEGELKAEENCMSFCQTSASSGEGVEELFFSIIENIQMPRPPPEPIQELDEHHNSRRSSSVSTTVNKAKIVKIGGEEKKQFPCCYI